MISEERLYWLVFAVCSGVGPKKFALLLEHFGSAKNAWESDEIAIHEVVGPALTKSLQNFKENFSILNYQQKLIEKDGWFITLTDSEYPLLLKQIDNPPFVLFGKGNKELLAAENLIGVVGTRKVTSYGRQVTEMITKDLVEGVDCCYPSTNEKVYMDIVTSGGAIISDFPLSMQPSVGSFPSRNRIIAGMSVATLVTEGAEDSGSLITAHTALKYDRQVFAVPGPITSQLSTGPMKLIRGGGILITSADEIIKELHI